MRRFLFTCVTSALVLLPNLTHAFSNSGHKWDSGNPTYVTVTMDSSLPSAWIATIAHGMSAWNATTTKFRFNAGYAGHVVALRYLGNNATLAATYIREGWSSTRITDRDTDINLNYSWDVNGVWNKYDVGHTMTHEFGHWLTLLDLYNQSDYWKTMYGISGPGRTYQRTLEPDDANGMRAIYGA